MSSEALHQDSPKQEPGDLHPRAVLLAIAAIVVMVLIVALVAALLSRSLGSARALPPNTPPPPAPSLSSSPEPDITTFEREKRARLESYGWVDRDHGVAHVPIERAMEMLAARKKGNE
jgi:hypothetical protein